MKYGMIETWVLHCDKCGDEIDRYESREELLNNNDEKNYCASCEVEEDEE